MITLLRIVAVPAAFAIGASLILAGVAFIEGAVEIIKALLR